jgi:hypothetical protein
VPRRCRVCGRNLRNPLWRAAGLGPVCARRLGLVPSRRVAVVPVRPPTAVAPGEGQLSLFDDEEVNAR